MVSQIDFRSVKMRKNIIVLLLDTVRASDTYGNNQLSTINYLSRHATTYERAVAPGVWTPPSHAALFMDKRVSQIKQVSRNFLTNGTYKIDPWMVKTKFLKANEETLARKLSVYGYQSVLLSNNPFVTSFTNLATGFESVQDVWMESNIKYNKGLASKFNFILNGGAEARVKMIQTGYWATRFLPKSIMDRTYTRLRKMMFERTAKVDGSYELDRGSEDTNTCLKKYLSYERDYRPQFMFLNYIEAHEHYPVEDTKVSQDKWAYLSGVEEMNEYNMKHLHRGYLKRLRYLDRSVKKTLEILKSKGALENAAVIITSDHGQFFGEHGMLFHSLPPYEGISRVPLIAANYRNGKLVKSRDLVETPVSVSALHTSILDLAAGKYDYMDGNMRKDRYVLCEHTGVSEGWDEKLLSMLAPRSVTVANVLRAKRRYNKKVTAVYRKDMKLMHYFGRKKDELYNITKDQSESTNIIDSNRLLAHQMAASLYN